MASSGDGAGVDYAWFLGAAFAGGDDDQSARFIRDGVWEQGYSGRYIEEVKSIQPGDRIALKATYTRKHGLPFDNRGHFVSVMAIKATGIVTDNLGDGAPPSGRVDAGESAPVSGTSSRICARSGKLRPARDGATNFSDSPSRASDRTSTASATVPSGQIGSAISHKSQTDLHGPYSTLPSQTTSLPTPTTVDPWYRLYTRSLMV